MTARIDYQRLPLGKVSTYTGTYTPSLLQSLPRKALRDEASLGDGPEFFGADLWQAYEFSWLNPRGRPEVAVLRMEVPAASRAIVESKSLKLYLNSFGQTEFAIRAEVLRTLEADIGLAVGAPVLIDLVSIEELRIEGLSGVPGISLDTQEIDIRHYRRQPQLLACDAGQTVRETVFTNAFRTLCPVTGQPDWATVRVQYAGRPIDSIGLLRYLISHREEPAFHETTVERIFADISACCAPDSLSVLARFTRRGGIEINPFRSSVAGDSSPVGRLARQ